MRYVKFFVIALALLLPSGFIAYAEEAGAGREKRVAAVLGADGVQRAEVLGGGYYFDPNVIVVKVNVPVELVVKKESGITPHDIVVKAPEAGIDFKVDLEEKSALVRFTPTKTGTYAMYCSNKFLWFKSHRERGMEGVIEVVE